MELNFAWTATAKATATTPTTATATQRTLCCKRVLTRLLLLGNKSLTT